MKEPYIEELATHDDPESCGAASNGKESSDIGSRSGAEALTGESPGRVLSREIQFGVRTTYGESERNIGRDDMASFGRTPRGLRPLAWMDTFCAGIGRSRLWPMDFPLARTLNLKGARE